MKKLQEEEEGKQELVDSDEGAIHSRRREKKIVGLLDERSEPEPIGFEKGKKRYCEYDGQFYTLKQLKESLRGLSTDEVTLSLWASFSTPAAARVDAETGKLFFTRNYSGSSRPPSVKVAEAWRLMSAKERQLEIARYELEDKPT